jgi:hypothetical protein
MPNDRPAVLLALLLISLLLSCGADPTPAAKVESLMRQLKTGKFLYLRESAGCVVDGRLLPPYGELAPNAPCRQVTLRDHLFFLPFSDCAGRCKARENAISCLYDMRDVLKGDSGVTGALKELIATAPPDYAGEAVCLQKKFAETLLEQLSNEN